jgi:DNA modification methylase
VAVCYREISKLTLDTRNPRLHSPKQVRQIARSIQAFGFVVPVLIDAKLKVVAGHGRVMACRLLGRSQVPTISLDHLSETQIRAFAIADNRLTENSEWNDRLLAEQLRDLAVLDLDFDLEATGFEMAEIDLRIEGLTSESEDVDLADAIPQIASGAAVSRPSDLWLLGRHRVYCGNALESAVYAALMDRSKAAMVFTDPPFNVAIAGNVSGFGAVRHREFAMGSGEMTTEEFTDFLTAVIVTITKNSTAGSIHYNCIDWRHLVELHDAGGAARLQLVNLCVWAKDTAAMGSLYRSRHELVFVFRNGRERHRNNVQLGQFGRNRTNLWQYPGAVGLRASEEGNLIALHPTPKPVALIADAIMDVSARGDIVLDSFLGSGSTVIAAERTGRRCYGIEIDPLYVDVIVRRWQVWTRDHARHAASGRFDELEAEAEARNGD